MKKLSILILLVFLSCSRAYIKTEVGPKGKIVSFENVKLNFPRGAVLKSTTLKIGKRSERIEHFKEGYGTSKQSFYIKPETLVFEKPILISIPVKNERTDLAVKLERGYLPIADSRIENDTLLTPIYHAGSYSLLEMPEKYGILNSSETKEALLLISDIYTGQYLEEFRKYLKKDGYTIPIWTFIYPPDRTIEEDAKFLHDELSKLHKSYADFRLDVVGFGVGGLICQRYEHDSTLYEKDLGSAIIAIGTPFKGSNLADLGKVKNSNSPFRFFFIDGMRENAADILPDSPLLKWIKENRFSIRRGSNFYDTQENSNFASIRGLSPCQGKLPEVNDGDGLVSIASTYLTPLEPEPFHLNHFQLYENQDVYKTIKGFLDLYHKFNWPELFLNVWKGKEDFDKINETWVKEVNLHFRNRLNFELLLDFNENLLLSVPEDGILITNGDNDTYPGWYLQAKGVRKDVLIVNWSLLNVAENVLYLKKEGLPIPLTEEEIRSLRPIRKKSGEIVTPADSLIKALVKNKERPVVFSSTVSPSRMKEYPLRLRGLVFEFGEGKVDVKNTKALFHSIYKLDKTFSTPPESLNLVCKMMVTNYSASLYMMSKALVDEKRYDEALNEIEYAKALPVSPHFLSPLYSMEGSIYYKLNKPEKANETLKKALDIEKNSNTIKGVAQTYYENERRKEAIKVLADWLKDHPDDKSILEQLTKYGEE